MIESEGFTSIVEQSVRCQANWTSRVLQTYCVLDMVTKKSGVKLR